MQRCGTKGLTAQVGGSSAADWGAKEASCTDGRGTSPSLSMQHDSIHWEGGCEQLFIPISALGPFSNPNPSYSVSSAELDAEHAQKVLEMEHTQHMKLKERQKFFEEAFQQDMEQYLSTGYLQIAERRGELGPGLLEQGLTGCAGWRWAPLPEQGMGQSPQKSRSVIRLQQPKCVHRATYLLP